MTHKEYCRAYYLRHRDKFTQYARDYRARNPEKIRAAAKIRRDALAARKRKLTDDAKNRPCADCHQSFPSCCMDFDHPPGTKEIAIGPNVYNPGVSFAKLKAEIEKCEVVCSNCHRIRTHITRKRA